MPKIKAVVAVAVVLLACLAAGAEAKSFSFEMRFKQGDELEKTQRLKILHEMQLSNLDESEQEQLEQAAGMVTNRNGTADSFSADTNARSSLITVPVTFGTQTFDLTLDTGSTVLWITSATCQSYACSAHRGYNASASSTFSEQNPTTNFEIEYGSGSVEGHLAFEKVSLGDLVSEKQCFGLVTREDGRTFENAQWSGLLGLAYPALAAFDGNASGTFEPFFDSVMKKNVLNQNAFSFWLVRSESSPPMFFLGTPPTLYYTGKLQFVDVVEKYHWTINLIDILVDNQSLGLCPTGCKVAVDTGTAYMGAPTADLPIILRALTGSTATSACQHNLNRTITYILDGGKRVTLEPEFYFTTSITGEICKVKYIGLDVERPHGPLHIFGDALFRKYFVHFDRDHDRIGFAIAKRTITDKTSSLQSLLLSKLRSLV